MPIASEVAPDVFRIPISIANAYIVGTKKDWTLIDTGTPGNEDRVIKSVKEVFDKNAAPEAILLTHGHFDHAGSARALAEHWDVPVYAHRLEIPFLDGRSAYPPPDPTVGGFMSQMIRFIPNKKMDVGDHLQELDTDDLPGLRGWECYETPGHTPGHVSFFRPDDNVLIAGDAFTTIDQDSFVGMVSRTPVVSRPPAYYTCDWDSAQNSVEILAGLRPHVLAAGHGVPMQGRIALQQLIRLAKDFPAPEHGRYVGNPPETDEDGVQELPPPAPDPVRNVATVVSIAALAGAGWAIAAKRKRAA